MANNNILVSSEAVKYFREIRPWTFHVDPGPSTGVVAIRQVDPGKINKGTPYVNVFWPVTLTDEQAQDHFAKFCLEANRAGAIPRLVIEEYRIYPGKEMVHSGKEIPTAEVIGGFTYIARRMKAEVVKQPSQIKQTTRGMTRGRNIRLQGATQHERDAELHMWYSVFRKVDI